MPQKHEPQLRSACRRQTVHLAVALRPWVRIPSRRCGAARMPDERTPARTKGQAPAGEPAAETAAGTGAAAANGSRGPGSEGERVRGRAAGTSRLVLPVQRGSVLLVGLVWNLNSVPLCLASTRRKASMTEQVLRQHYVCRTAMRLCILFQ